MSKFLFVPFSVIGGIVAGIVGKKTFDMIWGVIDDEEAPDPKHRKISLKKLIPALILEGALFRAVLGLSDHGTGVCVHTMATRARWREALHLELIYRHHPLFLEAAPQS